MKIPQALESMIADLISDEKKKREEVEAILSQIHELTEPFFNPPDEIAPSEYIDRADPSWAEEPAPVLSDAERVENFTKAFERRGMPPERARDAAEEACGLRDGSR